MSATGQAKIQEADPLLPVSLSAIQRCRGVEGGHLTVYRRAGAGVGRVFIATQFLRCGGSLQKHDLLLFFDEVQAGFGRCGDAMAWRMIAPEIQKPTVPWAGT
jgi:hypothetical protein